MDSLTITPDSPAILDQLHPHAGELARLRAELERAKSRIAESFLLPGDLNNFPAFHRFAGGEWGSGGPFGIGGFGGWGGLNWDRSQNKQRAPIPFMQEPDWRMALAASQDLCTRYDNAIGLLSNLVNYVGAMSVQFVLRGQSPGAVASGPADADSNGEPDVDPLIAAAAEVWDDWRELNHWGEGSEDREQECRSRLPRHGEVILRFFQGGYETDGICRARFVEPEQARTPDSFNFKLPPELSRYSLADLDMKWGVINPPEDKETVLGLALADWEEPSRIEIVPASKYVRTKRNVDRSMKRGLPDFFPSAEDVHRLKELDDNMIIVAALQAAIAWVEEYGPTHTQAQVQAAITQGQDYSGLKVMPWSGAKETSVRDFIPGSILHTEHGRQKREGPVSTGAAGFMDIGRYILRRMCFRFNFPESFAGSGADTFASVLINNAPFVNEIQTRQQQMIGFVRDVAMMVVRLAEKAGRLPPGASKQLKAIVTAKPIVIADEEKQTRITETRLKLKLTDPQTEIKKLGGIPAQVAANNQAWEAKMGPVGGEKPPSPFGGGQPPGGIGAGMTPAPPGSAGGDGSSGLEAIFGEDRSALVKQTITDKNGVQRTVWVSPDEADAADQTAEHPAAKKAKSLLARIAEVPVQLKDKVTSFVKTKYTGMVAKYGKRGAAAILAATVLLLPVPIPGTSLVPIALANAVMMLKKAITGEAVEQELTDEQVQAAARELIAELYAAVGEEPPELAG